MGIAALGVVGFGQSAQAILFVDIFDNGSDQTRWVFSGSAVAGGSGFFEDGIDLASDDAWQNIGNYTTRNDVEDAALISNSATLTIEGITRAIDLPYIDNDSGTNADDFGVGVAGSTDFTFVAGNTISWTGQLITDISINDLSETPLPVTFNTDNYGGTSGVLDLQVNIGGSASVPFEFSPSTGIILSLGLFGAHYGWRKKQQKEINL